MRKRMHGIRAGAVLAILVLAMAPASRAGTPSCPAGFEEFTEYRLFLGRSRGDVEVVSGGFLAAEITPRFPDGLTVLDAAGQWRDGSGAIMRERTKLVIVLAKPGAAAHGGDCGGVQAFLRPGGRIAYDHTGLRVVLGLCALPPRTRWSARVEAETRMVSAGGCREAAAPGSQVPAVSARPERSCARSR